MGCGDVVLRLGPRVTIDFETRSKVSLDDVGGYAYTRHPSTEVHCLAYHLPEDPLTLDCVRLWHKATQSASIAESPPPLELFHAVNGRVLIEAHNAGFEWDVWHNIMVPRHGWPPLQADRVACSAAKAAAHALPRALEDLCVVLRTSARKDMEGHALMRRMSKPRKLKVAERKALLARGIDPDSTTQWQESREELERLWTYCRRDVLAEAQSSEALPDLSPSEWEVYLLDQVINRRGFFVDEEGLRAALHFVDEVCQRCEEELVQIAGDVRPTQRLKLKAWLHEHGVLVPDTQGATVDEWLASGRVEDAEARRVLEIMRAVNRTSTAKYRTLEAYTVDGRVRRTLVYHGASTGRWTGSGPQPHNFPRGTVSDMDTAWEDVVKAFREKAWGWVEFLHGEPMDLLSGMTRGSIVAPQGRELLVADYAAIEARVVLWLAGEEAALEVFRAGRSIYCDLAEEIYGRPIDKKKDPVEYQIGKQGILGLGFGMGPPKFVTTVHDKAGINIPHEFASEVVKRYRKKYVRIPAEWWGQEAAAISAAANPGRVFRQGRCAWKASGRTLRCRRPSGEHLTYYDPVVTKKLTPWGEERDCLTFMAVDPKTKQWRRQDTYGGTLVENIVQATARDVMAAGMKAAEAAGYSVVLTVHDEVVAEVPEGFGSVEELIGLLTTVPAWAEGCPIGAEGWRGRRYRK